MILYELDGRDGRRFSPFCWRTDMAIRHKGLEAEHVAVGFADKRTLDFVDYKKVPVLVDGDRTVTDSWDIAVYLDEFYADRPALMAGPEARGLARFVNHWTDTVINAALAPMIVADILDDVTDLDEAHFRTTREARFGCRLEDVCGDLDQRLETFRKALTPARLTLGEQPFLSGAQPGYADYILFGSFQWAAITSDVTLLETDDPVFGWRERLLDLFNGYGRTAA
ncbi:MAG: glutathione S-transferase family protein [Rhodospirillales bacterium]